jgi:hypothetical protein
MTVCNNITFTLVFFSAEQCIIIKFVYEKGVKELKILQRLC